jgi:3-mercaptopyruvate sulfurtransferase SseA
VQGAAVGEAVELAAGRADAGMAVYDGSFSEWGLPGANAVGAGAAVPLQRV